MIFLPGPYGFSAKGSYWKRYIHVATGQELPFSGGFNRPKAGITLAVSTIKRYRDITVVRGVAYGAGRSPPAR